MGSAGNNGGGRRRSDGVATGADARGPEYELWPKFWVVNEGIVEGQWTLFCKVTKDYKKIHQIGGTFPLDKATIKLDIYCHQIAAINTAAAAFFREVAEAYMASPDFTIGFTALPKE